MQFHDELDEYLEEDVALGDRAVAVQRSMVLFEQLRDARVSQAVGAVLRKELDACAARALEAGGKFVPLDVAERVRHRVRTVLAEEAERFIKTEAYFECMEESYKRETNIVAAGALEREYAVVDDVLQPHSDDEEDTYDRVERPDENEYDELPKELQQKK